MTVPETALDIATSSRLELLKHDGEAARDSRWRGPAGAIAGPHGLGHPLGMGRPALDELRKLPLAERIELVEDLWDSIAADAEELPVPDSHREELARRRAAYRDDPGRVRPWEEVRERLWAEE
jgi:putative addiction module component (TIGR02574 family)